MAAVWTPSCHPCEGRGPGKPRRRWIPASAGMTSGAAFHLYCHCVRGSKRHHAAIYTATDPVPSNRSATGDSLSPEVCVDRMRPKSERYPRSSRECPGQDLNLHGQFAHQPLKLGNADPFYFLSIYYGLWGRKKNRGNIRGGSVSEIGASVSVNRGCLIARANAKSPDRMGGIVKRRLAMATLPCLGPSPRPSALTMPPVVREGRHPQHGRFQDFAFALA